MTQVQAGDIIQIVRPDGHTLPGQVFPASDPKAPAVVLIQEWWGLNDQIRGVGRRLGRGRRGGRGRGVRRGVASVGEGRSGNSEDAESGDESGSGEQGDAADDSPPYRRSRFRVRLHLFSVSIFG